MPAPKPTRGDRWREHREIFEYARAHGITLLEAKEAIDRDRLQAEQDAARQSWRVSQARLAAVRRCGRAIDPRPAPTPAGDLARPNPHARAPWMMED